MNPDPDLRASKCPTIRKNEETYFRTLLNEAFQRRPESLYRRSINKYVAIFEPNICFYLIYNFYCPDPNINPDL